MTQSVHIVMVLSSAHRTDEGVAKTQELATKLGLEPTTAGKTSLCFRASPETFTKIFGQGLVELDPQPAGDVDFGVPGGHVSEQPLSVPDALRDYVESVAVEPPARRLS